MTHRLNIRLNAEEKDLVQQKSVDLGYKSASGYARTLIKEGMRRDDLSVADSHVLGNSVQSVLLLRELVSMISGNHSLATEVINEAKKSSQEWLGSFIKQDS